MTINVFNLQFAGMVAHPSHVAADDENRWVLEILPETTGASPSSCPLCPVVKFRPAKAYKLAKHLRSSHLKQGVRHQSK